MEEMKLDRKSRYTRKVLQDSLLELLAKKPITGISITEICINADINRTTFYAHYRDQYDLLRQIEETPIIYVESLIKKYEDKQTKRDVLQMLEEILQSIADNSNSFQVLLSENGDPYFQKKLFRRFTYGKQMMEYSERISGNKATAEYYSIFVINGAVGFIQHWLKNNMSIPVPELAKMLINLIYPKEYKWGY
jgi:AcrR family transcriptional regulator